MVNRFFEVLPGLDYLNRFQTEKVSWERFSQYFGIFFLSHTQDFAHPAGSLANINFTLSQPLIKLTLHSCHLLRVWSFHLLLPGCASNSPKATSLTQFSSLSIISSSTWHSCIISGSFLTGSANWASHLRVSSGWHNVG